MTPLSWVDSFWRARDGGRSEQRIVVTSDPQWRQTSAWIRILNPATGGGRWLRISVLLTEWKLESFRTQQTREAARDGSDLECLEAYGVVNASLVSAEISAHGPTLVCDYPHGGHPWLKRLKL